VDLTNSRILIVDDQEENLKALSAVLAGAGYSKVNCLIDSRQIPAVFQEFRPDLVLLDLHMPHVDGIAAMDWMASVTAKDDYMPILVLTGDGSFEAKQKALSHGAHDFLHKPLNRAEVQLRVRNLLETRHLHLQLKAQNELQTSLLDQVHDAILTLDEGFQIQYMNAGAARLFGWTAREAVGQHYKTVAGTVVTQAERESIHADILTQGTWNGEIICTRQDGTQFIVHVSWSVLRDNTGRPQGVVGIHRDITAPKQMEQALRATEDRLQLAQSALALGTWEIDLASGTVQCSEQLLSLYGLSGLRNRILLEEWHGCIHPEDRERKISEEQAHLQDRDSFDIQYRVVWPDQSVHWLHSKAKVIFAEHQRANRIIGVDLDITEQKRVERANADLAAIVECADAAIISKDLQGVVLTWNRGAERVYGYAGEEMIGKTMMSLVPQDRLAEETEIMETLHRGQAVHHLDTVRLTKSGQPISVLLTISPILDRCGSAIGAAHVAWDLTHLKQLEQQLAQAQKLESIGQLAAGIAHEINTPIQYVGDNAKFLQDAFRDLIRFAQTHSQSECGGSDSSPAPPLPTQAAVEKGILEYLASEVPKATEQLLQGVDHVARIVRAMKEFSHPGQIEKTLADLNTAVETTVAVSKNEWKYVAVLTTDLDRNLPLVPCLLGEFNQVILNLIVNAAHAIADVKQHISGLGRIHISTRLDARFAEIRVSDTGGGIPESIHEKVFDPFFTTKSVGKGTGQGLAIAHAVIVQKHNGTIHFESESGKGTTFVIRLPLESDGGS
jgi:PAS domain S-box-containing protein